MGKHRNEGEAEAAVRVELAGRLRTRHYLFATAALVVLLLVGTAWVLTEPRLPAPNPVLPASAQDDQAVEGFGQPSPSPSISSRPSPRVSPGKSPEASTQAAIAGAPAPPAAHYKFDEASGTTTADASGHGRTATLNGAAAFAAGRLGNGVSLGGSSQYVALPTGILSGATSFSFSAWVRLDTVTTWCRVFDFGTGTGVNMFLSGRSNAGTARFAITTGGNGGEQQINARSALPTGAWTHVAVTLSGGTGIIYVNKAEVARATGITLNPASLGSTTKNWIGRSQYAADPYLDGIVDDVRVYSRALSAGEIAALP